MQNVQTDSHIVGQHETVHNDTFVIDLPLQSCCPVEYQPVQAINRIRGVIFSQVADRNYGECA
jgi:hypothetical protein